MTTISFEWAEVPSRFSNSRLVSYRRCPRQYRYQYGTEGGPDSSQKRSLALRVGTAGHAAMASFYRGEGVMASIGDAFDSMNPSSPEDEAEFDKLEATLVNYFEHYKSDNWKVLAVEVEVEARIQDMAIFGIIDLIIEMAGKRVIVDHKFLSKVETKYLDMDPQINYYLLLAQQLRYPIDGFLYNMIDKRKSDGNPGKRMYITRTPNQLTSLSKDFYQVGRMITATHEGQIPVYRNPTQDCRWDCSYYDACIASMQKGE